ncbi:MAG: hypothetical protein NZ901_03845 [Geminocystis sp.]|nr:hypothetical protein [Geminocystis sp.]HIK36432.1 hypothetical protein [Geminocystis sp. M7585_C2015_104]MCS7147303.1 hypothetical protein [Geminocystis sp.]MCX8078813.1 hypothetical protein [Geminocystis sp.]MDW8116302.1 hypothetical protein [Geminocystis sp.]
MTIGFWRIVAEKRGKGMIRGYNNHGIAGNEGSSSLVKATMGQLAKRGVVGWLK